MNRQALIDALEARAGAEEATAHADRLAWADTRDAERHAYAGGLTADYTAETPARALARDHMEASSAAAAITLAALQAVRDLARLEAEHERTRAAGDSFRRRYAARAITTPAPKGTTA